MVAEARRREDHVNATWRAWREAFFDLIAGKPHLPSVAAAAESGAAAQLSGEGASAGSAASADRPPAEKPTDRA